MGTAVGTATTSPASWDVFADVDAFVEEVLTELAAMAANGARPIRSGPKPALSGASLRKAIGTVKLTGPLSLSAYAGRLLETGAVQIPGPEPIEWNLALLCCVFYRFTSV